MNRKDIQLLREGYEKVLIKEMGPVGATGDERAQSGNEHVRLWWDIGKRYPNKSHKERKEMYDRRKNDHEFMLKYRDGKIDADGMPQPKAIPPEGPIYSNED